MVENKKEVAEKALELILQKGCGNARVTLNVNTQSSYAVRNDKLDRLYMANNLSLYLQLFVEGKYGAYSTNRTDKEELDRFINHAIETTKLLAPDPYRSLPDPSLYFKGEQADLKQYDTGIKKIKPTLKRNIAFNCANEILKKDNRIISVNCEYSDLDEFLHIIDSNGFSGSMKQTLFSLSSECSVKGNGDSRPEGWWYENSLFFKDLKKDGVGHKSYERAISRLNPKKLKSGIYNMVLENTISSRMIAPIVSALNGAAIQQNNSFLKGKLGERVFSNRFQLIDTPHLEGAYGARFFDSEGIATKKMNIIENGIINYYFINTYYSAKLSTPSTIEGPSVPTCKFACSPDTPVSERLLNDLLENCENGILVTGFNGGNSNSSTGDFSFGIQGFYFENGELLFPIKEMNVTGNLITLWNNLIDAGTDPRKTGRWLIPSLAFESVNFNGI